MMRRQDNGPFRDLSGDRQFDLGNVPALLPAALSVVQMARVHGWGTGRLGELTPFEFAALADGVARASRLVVSELKELRPTERGDANRPSLSRLYGHDRFPLHTDGAHLLEPPRFLLLYCHAASGAVATRVAPWAGIAASPGTDADIQSAVFLVSGGRASFYATIRSVVAPCYRFDSGCMRPVNAPARQIVSVIHAVRDAHGEILMPGFLLVVDNWTVLHGRDPIAPEDRGRRLWRASLSHFPWSSNA